MITIFAWFIYSGCMFYLGYITKEAITTNSTKKVTLNDTNRINR